MQPEAKERTPLQRALDTLPSRHGVISNAQKALADKGTEITLRQLYEVVKGRSRNPVLIEAILDAIEATKTRTAELAARAEKLAEA